MRRALVAGNWKMHGDARLVAEFAAGLTAAALPASVDVLLLPPAPYLGSMAAALRGSRILVGAQNVHAEPQGAFTGEIAAEMVRDVGAAWTLVGHSERRQLFAEADAQVAEKYQAALRAGLRPILCVGESLAERESGKAEAVVLAQLDAVIDRVGAQGLDRGLIAYEPVWAIGTGRTATPEQAQDMHGSIRQWLADLGGELGRSVSILYGGSVKAANARALFEQPDIDGGLVGGASLDLAEFMAIVRAAAGTREPAPAGAAGFTRESGYDDA
ncbi:MAG: triose-phosphate isomerase [Pseudomonadales bacterium]